MRDIKLSYTGNIRYLRKLIELKLSKGIALGEEDL
jgi:hypothetical protein